MQFQFYMPGDVIIAACEKSITVLVILDGKAIVLDMKGETKAKLVPGDHCGEFPLLIEDY